MKRIGIVGSGAVAKALARGFKKHGYDVLVGSGNPAKREALEKELSVKAGSFEEAASFGEGVVLAIKGHVAEKVVESIQASLSKKVVFDATNPISENPPVNGILNFFTGPNESLMERLQTLAPDAHFVKVWNCVGSAFMVEPDFGGTKPTMFIAGNSADAKAEVTSILAAFGWETEDIGAVEGARAIEPLCILWCAPGFQRNQWSHVFKLLKK